MNVHGLSEMHSAVIGERNVTRMYHKSHPTAPLDKTGKSSSPVTGLEWPRGFQEVKVPRFHDNGTGWW